MRHANLKAKQRILKMPQLQQDRLVAVLETVSRTENMCRECPKVRGLKQNVSKVTALGSKVTDKKGALIRERLIR